MTELQLYGLTEKQLREKCIAGDRVCQELLYKVYAPRLFTLCLRYSADYHTAEDILQEGFIKVFNNIDKFRGDGAFEGWLKRIFINTAIQNQRKRMKAQELDEYNLGQANIHVKTNVLSELATKEIMNLVQNLPNGYRTVFNMYVIDGFSHKEIAGTLQISEGTSKSQLARARNLLKHKIISLKTDL